MKLISFEQYILGLHKRLLDHKKPDKYHGQLFLLKKRFMKEKAQVVQFDKDFTIIKFRKKD